ncbi:hypothetical protein jhhlp_008201 [Lomentospora prolificans]|uniref:3-beta hydroxysteroid dehydrogenase/isomerase domain-containing protein n=1 Tax=Lomentospora prolificans TaxID=41688 RepID=A0A2N3MZB8_9PEZI|nr:hypothetical protein jhhlp_008201 [Lomentospora prolificans]
MPIFTLTMLAKFVIAISIFLVAYLVRLNSLLKGVPQRVQELRDPGWTTEQLTKSYRELEDRSFDYSTHVPPRLNRRYIVTGGNGLVGGYIVLQLLARGTPPEHIRIIDIRAPERNDLKTGQAVHVDYIPTDIRSRASVDAAFDKPWPPSAVKLPLTVFHTAAVILASDRSKHLYGFPEAVNVRGTENVMKAAQRVGADIFSSTSSASISIHPVRPFVFFSKEPGHFWQVLDEQDFQKPLRPHQEFFGNYAASKAVAERIVCNANCASFRTGCIRPANGVYGNATDNTVGGPLSSTVFPTWVSHIVQSFVHGANVALAHLQHEEVLVSGAVSQSGRPFVVTDPNPPISYRDLYKAIATLSVHPFHPVTLQPVLMLLMSHLVEWYNLLPYRVPFLRRIIPELKGDVKHLQPALFSICTHLIGSDADARKPVAEGGLGYKGMVTTLEGMVMEIIEWNREHRKEQGGGARKSYTTSVSLAEKLRVMAPDFVAPSGNVAIRIADRAK